MPYALIYRYDPSAATPADDEVPAWLALDEELRKAGIHVYEAGFHPAADGVSVTVRGGETTSSDATVESGEQIAGLYVIDAPSIEDAAGWAARIPTAAYGSVEVRQVVVFDTAA